MKRLVVVVKNKLPGSEWGSETEAADLPPKATAQMASGDQWYGSLWAVVSKGVAPQDAMAEESSCGVRYHQGTASVVQSSQGGLGGTGQPVEEAATDVSWSAGATNRDQVDARPQGWYSVCT